MGHEANALRLRDVSIDPKMQNALLCKFSPSWLLPSAQFIVSTISPCLLETSESPHYHVYLCLTNNLREKSQNPIIYACLHLVFTRKVYLMLISFASRIFFICFTLT